MNYTQLLLSLGVGGASMTAYAELDKRPNVVFILADDLGYGDLACYGQQLIDTPHLDSLARVGMRFTNFYAGCSVSAPSRASLLTGLHSGHGKIRGNKEIKPEGQEPLEDIPTIAHLFQTSGYRTGLFGKWGLGYPASGAEPQDRGFDEFYGYNCQRESHLYYPTHLWHNRVRVLFPENINNARQTYAADLIHQEGLKFISRASIDTKPFFAMLAYTLPHAELNLPHRDLYHKYRERLIPKRWQPKWSGDYPATEDAHASFAAMVEQLDCYIGEVCLKLRELGISDNTLIIFTSDNGPHIEGGADPEYFNSNGPLRGTKRALYEGGIRVPMIAVWANHIKANSINHETAAFWDFHKTFSSLLGLENKRSDGISLLPTLLRGKALSKKRPLYWEFHEEGGRMAIRYGKWKLIKQQVNTSNPYVELYDLEQDQGEKNDLSGTYPKIRRKLEHLMLSMRTPSRLFPFKGENEE